MPHPSHSSWYDHLDNTGEQKSSWTSHYAVSLVPCPVIPVRPENLSRYLIFKTPQPRFLPQWETKFDAHIKRLQNRVSVKFNLYIFGKQTRRQNIRDRMVVSIPGIQCAPRIWYKSSLSLQPETCRTWRVLLLVSEMWVTLQILKQTAEAIFIVAPWIS